MSTPTCGATTAAGQPCKRRVVEDGVRCPQHPENGSGAAESGRKRQETPLASIIALARGDNLKLSAAAGSMSERTLRERWHADGELRHQVSRARGDMLARGVGRLADLIDEATQTLRDVMSDDEASPGSRVSAARTVLTVSADLYELHEIEARLANLERIEDRRQVAKS